MEHAPPNFINTAANSKVVGKSNVSVVCPGEKAGYVPISISDIGFIFQSERGFSEITDNLSK